MQILRDCEKAHWRLAQLGAHILHMSVGRRSDDCYAGTSHRHWARGGTAEYGRKGGFGAVSPIECGRGVWAKSGCVGLFAHKVGNLGSYREG